MRGLASLHASTDEASLVLRANASPLPRYEDEYRAGSPRRDGNKGQRGLSRTLQADREAGTPGARTQASPPRLASLSPSEGEAHHSLFQSINTAPAMRWPISHLFLFVTARSLISRSSRLPSRSSARMMSGTQVRRLSLCGEASLAPYVCSCSIEGRASNFKVSL